MPLCHLKEVLQQGSCNNREVPSATPKQLPVLISSLSSVLIIKPLKKTTHVVPFTVSCKEEPFCTKNHLNMDPESTSATRGNCHISSHHPQMTAQSKENNDCEYRDHIPDNKAQGMVQNANTFCMAQHYLHVQPNM